jgi:protein-S-isoprenylcysteine O-methyltransferase Ste14
MESHRNHSTIADDSTATAQCAYNLVSRVRNARGYDLASRAFGSAWFLGLAILVARSGMPGPGAQSTMISQGSWWPEFLCRAGLVSLYLTLWLLVLLRPTPFDRSRGILPNVMAFAGTYMPWLIVLFPRHDLSGWAYVISTALVLSGNALALCVVWNLGRSFSIVPQARRLVTNGPYALVRHPLYLAEEVMLAGTAIVYWSPLALAFLAVHLAVQIGRMRSEETVLRRAFPDYREYAERTRMLLPSIPRRPPHHEVRAG